MTDRVLEINDDGFNSFIRGGLAIVEFYGAYCPPCKSLEPVLEKLARDRADRAAVAKINVDEFSGAAADHSVEDIPTLIFFKNGEEAERLFGAQKFETLAGVVDRLTS